MQGVPWSNPACPVLFINVEGSEQQASAGNGTRHGGDGASYSNPQEARIAVKALLRVLQHDDGVQSVALLSPYRRVVACSLPSTAPWAAAVPALVRGRPLPWLTCVCGLCHNLQRPSKAAELAVEPCGAARRG